MLSPSPASFVHPSNALTYGSLLLGVAAIGAAMTGSAPASGALLAAAAITDTFDGRFARRFRRTPELASMGAQLDSLTDAVTFGAAPIVIAGLLFRPTGGAAEWIWWAAAFVYTACALTRLGFYNVWDGELSGFVGLPTPVAALFWSTLLLLDAGAVALTVVALTTSLAMIAPLRIPRPEGLALAAFVLWPLALIAVHASRLG
jgi:CDP-diacylglycerol--serine O-phosphatidyltransferase